MYSRNIRAFGTTIRSMSRRKNKIIASNDGWSNVVGKGRAPLRKPSELNKLGNSPHDTSNDTIDSWDTTDYDSWVLEATRSLAGKAAELKASGLWQIIKTEIEKIRNEVGQMGNLVVLGLGSLQGDTRESSFWQLVLALEMGRLLHGEDGYKLYVQDPVFTVVDIRFFKEKEATVLQHPEAEIHITEQTFLYAPHLEYDILQASLKYNPAVVFCNDLQNFLDTKLASLVDYPVFIHYLENYTSLILRGVDNHNDIGDGRAFNHSALYWRQQQEKPRLACTFVDLIEQIPSGGNAEGRKKGKEKRGERTITLTRLRDGHTGG